MKNLLNKCKKEIKELEQIECDIQNWSRAVPVLGKNDKSKLLEIETQMEMLEQFIQWIEEEQNK
jgi:hypothetical protein